MLLRDTKHQLGILQGLGNIWLAPAGVQLSVQTPFSFTMKPPTLTSSRVAAISLLKWLESVQRSRLKMIGTPPHFVRLIK